MKQEIKNDIKKVLKCFIGSIGLYVFGMFAIATHEPTAAYGYVIILWAFGGIGIYHSIENKGRF